MGDGFECGYSGDDENDLPFPNFLHSVLGIFPGFFLTAGVVMAESGTGAEDRAAVSAVLLRYGAELNDSHTDTIVKLYTTDGVFMPSGAPTATGREQLRQAYDAVFSAIKLAVKFEIEEVEIAGRVAYARTVSRGQVTVLANGTTQAEENRELFILRQEQGQWRIARYMFNQAHR